MPRYGPGVGGGSELLVRHLAEALTTRRWSVSVWTTTAGDEATWSPRFPPGDDLDGRVRVRRFPVVGRRHPGAFHQLSRAVFRLPPRLRPEAAWIALQGPFSPALVRALATAADRPTLFMPYLYHPTVRGLPRAPHPRLLMPAAHDEPALRLGAVGRAVAAADGLWYGTEEERALLERVHPLAATRPHAVGNAGISPPAGADPDGFRQRHGLGRYLLYAGRATPGKGMELLLRGHALLRRVHPEVTLLLIGDHGGVTPGGQGVVSLGWVSDEDRWSALAGAVAVVVPSRLESLSLVALEAWASGRPCLLNRGSPVLEGQANRSGGALLFDTAASLAAAAAQLVEDPEEARRRGEAGRRYVALNHRWNAVVRRLEELIAAAATASAGPGWRGLGPVAGDPGPAPVDGPHGGDDSPRVGTA